MRQVEGNEVTEGVEDYEAGGGARGDWRRWRGCVCYGVSLWEVKPWERVSCGDEHVVEVGRRDNYCVEYLPLCQGLSLRRVSEMAGILSNRGRSECTEAALAVRGLRRTVCQTTRDRLLRRRRQRSASRRLPCPAV